MGDNCPKGCKHITIHFCMESGTHCDIHCVCSCRLCMDERLRITNLENKQKSVERKKRRISNQKHKTQLKGSDVNPDFHPIDCPAQFPSEPE